MGLISTIDQFRDHVGVNYNTELDPFKSDLRLIEQERIKPLVGPAFYNQLTAKLKAEETLTDAEADVLELLRCATCTLAMVQYLPLNQVQISALGVHIVSENSRKTAFQWQINELIANFTRKGFNALERALDLLDENIDAPEFTAWATSAARTQSQKFFLNSAKDFSEHYNIGSSRLTYLALLPTLRKMERFSIEPVLGTAFYLELKEQVLDKDLSAENEQLLDLFVRPALAHLVVAKAVPELGLAFNGESIELMIARIDDSNKKEADASIDTMLALKVESAMSDGMVYLEKLKSYLNTHASATKFPTYFASSTYQVPGGPRAVVRTASDGPVYGWM